MEPRIWKRYKPDAEIHFRGLAGGGKEFRVEIGCSDTHRV